MATEWTVLVFGDSWAQYMHPTWGEILARRLSAKLFNFAQAGSLCHDLPRQAQMAISSPSVPKGPGGMLKRETLLVVHTGGNDFIQKMVEALMGGGGLGMLLGGGQGMPAPAVNARNIEILNPNPGVRELAMLSQFCETVHRAGARHILMSGVPAYPMPIFNMLLPILGGLVNAGNCVELGVSPGDPAELVLEVQAASLNERWHEMCSKFTKEHADCKCIFFDEVGALERIKNSLGETQFNQSMFDFSMFHPSPFGHEQLASEAHRTVVEDIPELAALCPHPDAKSQASVSPAPTPATAPPAAPVPSSAPEAPPKSDASAKPSEEATWSCGVCTLINEASSSVCAACETARPAAPMAVDEPKAKEEAERKAKEEAERKAKDEAERKPKEESEARPLTVRVRNVKGDVTFSVPCDAGWHAGRLREAVVHNAPDGFVPPGAACLIALKGKFLQGDDPSTLAELGIVDGSQIIAAVKAPGSGSPKAGGYPKSASPAAAPGGSGYPAA